MNYKDQLVLTGALNDVGSPILPITEKVMIGLEVESSIAITDKLILNPNVTLSQNKNQDFLLSTRWCFAKLEQYRHYVFLQNLVIRNRLSFFTGQDFQIFVFIQIC